MIRRSTNGPICPHCGQLNPGSLLAVNKVLPQKSESVHGIDEQPATLVECIHCRSPFSFYIVRLPYFCTEDANEPRCNCNLHGGKDAASG